MKIVVDQMPDKPSDCPHSIYRDAKSYGWYGCSKRSIVCEIGQPGRECPIYTGLSDALASMANRIPIKKGDAIFYLDDDSGEIEEGIVNTVHYKNGAIDSFSVDFKNKEETCTSLRKKPSLSSLCFKCILMAAPSGRFASS